MAAFGPLSDDIRPALPEGVDPYSDPPVAGMVVVRYTSSNLGTYTELFSVVEGSDLNGEMTY